MDCFGGRQRVKSDINVTPLVDVVLVLLIIFMVVQPMLQMGYDVQVPPNGPPAGPERPEKRHQVMVTVTSGTSQDGAIDVYLNEEKVLQSNLPIRLQEVLRNAGSQVAYFSAEDTVNYGAAMHVMDILRNNGAKNIGFLMDYADPTHPGTQIREAR
jgi:biopolymer transport protein ExbD